MSARAGRSAAADSVFKFAGNSTYQKTRDAIAVLAEVYQPGLRVLLDTIDSDEVQDRLLRLGALRVIGDYRTRDASVGRER
jgi:hypothetical protein